MFHNKKEMLPNIKKFGQRRNKMGVEVTATLNIYKISL